MTDKVGHLHVKGEDGIIRGLNEHYDSVKDVEQDPYGAWLAIQNLWNKCEAEMMSNDLVARLRRVAEFGGTHLDGLWTEAADRIEQLEAELQSRDKIQEKDNEQH